MTEQEFKKVRVGDIVFYRALTDNKVLLPCLVENKFDDFGCSAFVRSKFYDGCGWEVPTYFPCQMIERTAEGLSDEQIKKADEMKALWKKVGKKRMALNEEAKERAEEKAEYEKTHPPIDRWWDWKFKSGDWSDYEK